MEYKPSLSDIRKLREITGMPLLRCKEALIFANGDFQMALKRLREVTRQYMKRSGIIMDG